MSKLEGEIGQKLIEVPSWQSQVSGTSLNYFQLKSIH